MKRRRNRSIRVADVPVPIVGDAAIAGQVAEGVNIPLVILDTAERPEVAELIRVQEHLPPGDVVSTWGGQKGRVEKEVSLLLQFDRPIETRGSAEVRHRTAGHAC